MTVRIVVRHETDGRLAAHQIYNQGVVWPEERAREWLAGNEGAEWEFVSVSTDVP